MDDMNPNVNEDLTLNKKRWQNRRRMAWTALISMIILTYFIMFTELASIERLKILSEVITWYYFACTSIVGSYMGFTTWASINNR